jgi:hypothetical protein
MLLEELEDEIDRWQKDFAPTASTSSIHDDFDWFRERPKKKGNDLNSKGFLSCLAFCCLGRVSSFVEFSRGFPLSSQGCKKSALVGTTARSRISHSYSSSCSLKQTDILQLDFPTLFSTIKPLAKHQERAGHNPAALYVFHALLRSFQSRRLPLHQKWSPWLQMSMAPRLPSRLC